MIGRTSKPKFFVGAPRRRILIQHLFEEYYRDEPFVDVMPPGQPPQTRSVRGANVCRLAVARPQEVAHDEGQTQTVVRSEGNCLNYGVNLVAGCYKVDVMAT